MRYAVIVLMDQMLVSLASYVVIVKIVSGLDSEITVSLLQLISLSMISYPFLNGIVCFRIIENRDDTFAFYTRELMGIGVLFAALFALIFVMFGWGQMLIVGTVLFVVTSLSHIARMMALGQQDGRALTCSSLALIGVTGALSLMVPQGAAAVLFLMPIMAGRLVQTLLNVVLARQAVGVNAGQGAQRFDTARFFAAVAQYARTNTLFWMFSFLAPAAVTVELRIIDMCLAPIRQLASSLQNYLIPRATSAGKVAFYSLAAAALLSPASIVLLTFFDVGEGRYGLLVLLLSGSTATILLSNAALILMRMRGQHGDIWRVILASLLIVVPVAAYFAQATPNVIAAGLVLELVMMCILLVRFLSMKESADGQR